MERHGRRSSSWCSEETSFPFLATLSPDDRTFEDVSETSDLSATLSLPFSSSTLEDASLFAVGGDAFLPAQDPEDLFSVVHRDAMRLTREEEDLGLSEGTTLDPEGLVLSVVAGSARPLSSPVSKALRDLRESCRLSSRPSAAGGDVPEDVPEGTTHSKSSSSDDGDSELWRLLDSNRDFRITQPGYDAFDEDCPHWLQSPAVPWSTMDRARAKCQEWLAKYFT